MEYMSRNKVYEKKPPSKSAKKLYIFCEGGREEDYFRYFQGLSSNLDIIPIPNENGKSDPLKLKQNAEKCFFHDTETQQRYCLSKDYGDQVWFVIDTDKWNDGNKIQLLKEYTANKNVPYEAWFVAQSNPSIEIWLYYHSFAEKPLQHEVDAHTTIKEYVDFKIKGGFDTRKMPVEIQRAIVNAEANFESADGQPVLFTTEVFRLGMEIVGLCKSVIDSLLADSQAR